MQVMSWLIARLGSRFSLLFEPHRRRVMHSVLGRFLDRPLDLMVGLVEPDGTERVAPFTQQGSLLYCPEQFERINSITFRGYSEHFRLRFEFNVHAAFYPQDEALCTTPAFYLEMRVSPAHGIGWMKPKGPTPRRIRLFIRLNRPDTQIAASIMDDVGRIDLSYRNTLIAQPDPRENVPPSAGPDYEVQVRERLVSLNRGCTVDTDGHGLILELPVTKMGSGIKWRLVWAAHCGERIVEVGRGPQKGGGRFRYASRLSDLDAVIDEAVHLRDDRLAHSRQFEKLFDQAPLRMAQRHLLHQSFQSFLGNTFWCDLDDGRQWFSTWDGRCHTQGDLDVEYNISLVYLALWPKLLAIQLDQWGALEVPHEPSSGAILRRDLGEGLHLAAPRDEGPNIPVEASANFLLMLQAYVHWTGDVETAAKHTELVGRLLRFLIWADRDDCGFASEEGPSAMTAAGPAVQIARRQTSLAVKRIAAIRAAGDMLALSGRAEQAEHLEQIVRADTVRIEEQAWLSDHYAVCTDRTTTGLIDAQTGDPLPYETIPGWDAYSIHTANGLLLPAMIGQPWMFDHERLRCDLTNATRETLGPYGCGHTSIERDDVWISQNLWRDHLACYLGLPRPHLTQRYWDMQVVANTADLSSGFVDTYLTNNFSFHPRGITSIGFLLAQPRLTIDRLAPGGQRISVEPDTRTPQRWPLLPLADWKAAKIPVCVVDAAGRVTIESESDPVIIHGPGASEPEFIG